MLVARISRYNFGTWLFWRVTSSPRHATALLPPVQRSLLASRSDSSNVRMSPSRTGPLTFLMSCLFCSFRNSTLTCVHCPWDPVLPRTFTTLARTIGFSMLSIRRPLSYRAITHVEQLSCVSQHSQCCTERAARHQLGPHADQMSSWQCSKRERDRDRETCQTKMFRKFYRVHRQRIAKRSRNNIKKLFLFLGKITHSYLSKLFRFTQDW